MSTYRQRLSAPASWWVGIVLLAVAVGWIVLVPTTWAHGLATTVSVVVVAGVVLSRGSLPVQVDEAGLTVGRAHLAPGFIGTPEALDSTTYRRRLGVDADARAYLATRPWADRGVMVPVIDPADPAPYWIIGSRDPQQLAAAIVQCRATRSERQ